MLYKKESQSLSRRWILHPHLAILYYILFWTFPCLSRRWLGHPHLTILYYAGLYYTIPYYAKQRWMWHAHPTIPYCNVLYYTMLLLSCAKMEISGNVHPHFIIPYSIISYYIIFEQRWRWHPYLS